MNPAEALRNCRAPAAPPAPVVERLVWFNSELIATSVEAISEVILFGSITLGSSEHELNWEPVWVGDDNCLPDSYSEKYRAPEIQLNL